MSDEDTGADPPEDADAFSETFAGLEVTPLGEGRYKLDAEFGLETVWATGIVLGVIGALVWVISLFDKPIPWEFGVVCGLLGGVSAVLRKVTDNYHLLDTTRRELFYHRRFLSRHTRRLVGRFSELLGLAVTGAQRSSKTRRWWEYHVVLVTRGGKILRISDPHEITPDALNAIAERLAELMEISFHPGKDAHEVRISRSTPSRPYEIHLTPPRATTARKLVVALVALVVVAVFVLIVAAFVA